MESFQKFFYYYYYNSFLNHAIISIFYSWVTEQQVIKKKLQSCIIGLFVLIFSESSFSGRVFWKWQLLFCSSLSCLIIAQIEQQFHRMEDEAFLFFFSSPTSTHRTNSVGDLSVRTLYCCLSVQPVVIMVAPVHVLGHGFCVRRGCWWLMAWSLVIN